MLNSTTKKMIEKILELYLISERDLKVHGNSFLEIGERSIKIIDPRNIEIVLNEKEKINHYIDTETKKIIPKEYIDIITNGNNS